MSVHTYTRQEAIDSVCESLLHMDPEEVLSTAQSLMREHLSRLPNKSIVKAYGFHFGSEIRVAGKRGGGA